MERTKDKWHQDYSCSWADLPVGLRHCLGAVRVCWSIMNFIQLIGTHALPVLEISQPASRAAERTDSQNVGDLLCLGCYGCARYAHTLLLHLHVAFDTPFYCENRCKTFFSQFGVGHLLEAIQNAFLDFNLHKMYIDLNRIPFYRPWPSVAANLQVAAIDGILNRSLARQALHSRQQRGFLL